MAAVSVSQFVMLYTWFVLVGVLLFLLLIARFYQRFSNEQTYFRLFILPIVLFGMSTVRYASINQIAGDGLGDGLTILAGVSLVVQCVFLYHLMSRNR
ncbi:MAG: hypothetical protein ABI690_28920 [Chloroflexota bacterium]